MREIENWKKFERKFGLTTNKKLLFENYYKFKKWKIVNLDASISSMENAKTLTAYAV